MSNKIQWYYEKQIIYDELAGEISLESIENGIKIMRKMLSETEDTVVIIIDATAVTASPTNIGQLTGVTGVLFEDEKIANMVVVSTKAMQRFFGNIVLRVFRKQSRIVASLEEAIMSIKQLNPSLPDLPQQPPNKEVIVVD